MFAILLANSLTISGSLIILFALVGVSSFRLVDINEFGETEDGRPTKSSIEGGIHSGLRLLFICYLTVVLTRSLITPDYPGGIWRVDVPLIIASVISVGAMIPFVLTALPLLKRLNSNSDNPSNILLSASVVLSALMSGAGHMLVACFASRLSLVIPAVPVFDIVVWTLAIGLASVCGFAMHYKLMEKLRKRPLNERALAVIDAASTAISPVVVIVGAAAFCTSAI